MRLHALLPALMVLAACPSAVKPEGLQYPCNADAGVECPSGWLCGRDLRCREAGVAGPFVCAVDADCEAGWHCTFEERCREVGVAGTYRCRTADDCEAQWGCSSAGACFDRTTPNPGAACARDEQCAVTYRCGLERTCRERGVVGPWQCALDSDCEAGWACGFDGRCLDPSPEQAEAARGVGGAVLERLSPLLPFEQTQQVSWVRFTDGSGIANSLVAQLPGQLVMFASEQVLQTLTTASTVVPLPPGSVALPSGVGGVVLLAPDGGVEKLRLTADGGLLRVGVRAPEPISVLRRLDTPVLSYPLPEVVLVGPSGGWVAELDGGVRSFPLPAAPVPDTLINSSQCRVAAAGDRLWVSFLADGGSLFADGGLSTGIEWLPQPAGVCSNVSDPSVFAGRRVVRLSTTTSGGLVTLARDGGPADEIAGFTTSTFPAASCRTWAFSRSCDTAPFFDARVMGPCTACAAGETMVSAVPLNNPRDVVVHCAAPDGGALLRRFSAVSADAGCSQTWVGRPANAPEGQPVRSTEGLAWVATPMGQLMSVSNNGFNVELNAERLETFMPVDPAQWARALGSEVVMAGQPNGGAALGALAVYTLKPGLGAVLADLTMLRPTPADGFPSGWGARAGDGVWDFERGQRVVATHPNGRATYQMAVATSADGGMTGLAASGDTVYSLELSGYPAMAPVNASWQSRFSPSVALPVLSLSVVSPSRHRVEGYALTGEAPWHFTSDSPSVWELEQLEGMPAGEYVELFRDGARVRIGYRDGRVYSLPSRLAIAPPIGAGITVQDFESACGQLYASSSAGLYRLEGAPDAGSWVSLDVSPAIPSRPAVRRGTLAGFADHVLFFSEWGTVVRVGYDGGCAPP